MPALRSIISVGAHGFDFFADGDIVCEAQRLVARASEQRGGMECGGEVNAVLFHPLAVLFHDAVIRTDDALRGDTPQADDDFRLDQPELLAQIGDACVPFIGQRVPVFRRAALAIFVMNTFFSRSR